MNEITYVWQVNKSLVVAYTIEEAIDAYKTNYEFPYNDVFAVKKVGTDGSYTEYANNSAIIKVWNSVKEGSPEQERNYYCRLRTGCCRILLHMDGRWYLNYIVPDGEKQFPMKDVTELVTHWHELPKPPFVKDADQEADWLDTHMENTDTKVKEC